MLSCLSAICLQLIALFCILYQLLQLFTCTVLEGIILHICLGCKKNKLKNSIIGKSLYTFFDILGVKNCKSKDDPQYKKKFRNEMGVSNLALKILIIRLHASLLQPCKFLVFLVVVVFVKLWNHKILASWHFLPTMIIH